MNVAVLTMVYRDHWYLALWVAYYGALFGRENLYVVSHGDEPEIREIAEGCTIIPYPRGKMRGFVTKRWNRLNEIQAELHDRYDCVISGDVDEIIHQVDPDEALVDVLARFEPHGVVCSLGYNLVEDLGRDPEMDDTRPVLAQRRLGIWCGGYSKPIVSYQPARYTPGAHRVRIMGTELGYVVAPDLMLAHLKFVDSRQFSERDAVRAEVTEGGALSLRDDDPWLASSVENHPVAQLAEGWTPSDFHESRARFESFLEEPSIRMGKKGVVAVGPRRHPAFEAFHLPESFAALF